MLDERTEDICVDFLLNGYEHCDTPTCPVECLTGMLDGDEATARAVMDAYHALPGEEQARLRRPELFDASLRNWLETVEVAVGC